MFPTTLIPTQANKKAYFTICKYLKTLIYEKMFFSQKSITKPEELAGKNL